MVAPGAHAEPKSFEPAGGLVLVPRGAEEAANLASCHFRAVKIGRARGCAHGRQRLRGSICAGHQVHRLPWARWLKSLCSVKTLFFSFLHVAVPMPHLVSGVQDEEQPCWLDAGPIARPQEPAHCQRGRQARGPWLGAGLFMSLVSPGIQAMEMTSQKEKDWVGKDTSETIVEDLEEGNEVPLSYFEREVSLSKELLHQTSCARLLDLSPNGLDMMLAAVDLKIYVCLVCKNSKHWSILEASLKTRLAKAMNDPENTRFFLSNERLGLSSESSVVEPVVPPGTDGQGGVGNESSSSEEE